MIVIDSSVLVAMAFAETEARQLAIVLKGTTQRLISAANLMETYMVVESRRGQPAINRLDILLKKVRPEVCAFDAEQVTWARYAFSTYGKGRHKAALNFGDCFAYALAKSKNLPLLFKGNDFTHTDIIPAVSA